MIAAMDPVLDPSTYLFVTDAEFLADAHLFALIHEAEGTTRIIGIGPNRQHSECPDCFRRIVLQVHSALDGVGLTAAVSTVLAEAGIACNVVAGFHHDHLFVPADRPMRAMRLLAELQASTRE